jgi:hypothetical protein
MKLGSWTWDWPTIAAAVFIFGSVAFLAWQGSVGNAARMNRADVGMDKELAPPKGM